MVVIQRSSVWIQILLGGFFFSKDTLSFDTLLSGLRSPSKSIRLHNPNRGAVELQRIWMEKGEASPFVFWVNGQYGRSFGQIRILGRDSIFLLIEAQFEGGERSEVTKETDNLRVSSTAGEHLLRLELWRQDAIFSEQLSITSDTHWSGTARHIGKELHVAKGATLSLGPGMRLFFAPGARLHAQGRLLANGSSALPIIFTSVRQDGDYKNTPGQWTGLVFDKNNEESVLTHVRISNADLGLRLGSPKHADGLPFRLGYSVLRDMSQGALLAYGGRTFVYNTLIYNAKAYLVSHHGGGDHRYLHCTLSNYPSNFVGKGASMQISDFLSALSRDEQPQLRLRMQNNIIWGELDEELQMSIRGQPQLELTHNLVRSATGQYLGEGNNLWQNSYDYPAFLDPEEKNYKLQEHSPARNKGEPLPDTEQQQDLAERIRDTQPDIGAYEWFPEEQSSTE